MLQHANAPRQFVLVPSEFLSFLFILLKTHKHNLEGDRKSETHFATQSYAVRGKQ